MRKKKVQPAPVDFTAVYNVVCRNCESVFQPMTRSPRWWEAKQLADKGRLDALCITGEECGCIQKSRKTNEPYRVFGFNDLCEDFDIPVRNFVDAVKFAIDEARHGSSVFIKGVSEAVSHRIAYRW